MTLSRQPPNCQTQSRLFALPWEIRCDIYQYAISNSDTKNIEPTVASIPGHSRRRFGSRQEIKGLHFPRGTLLLTCTCRRALAEVSEILLEEHRISLPNMEAIPPLQGAALPIFLPAAMLRLQALGIDMQIFRLSGHELASIVDCMSSMMPNLLRFTMSHKHFRNPSTSEMDAVAQRELMHNAASITRKHPKLKLAMMAVKREFPISVLSLPQELWRNKVTTNILLTVVGKPKPGMMVLDCKTIRDVFKFSKYQDPAEPLERMLFLKADLEALLMPADATSSEREEEILTEPCVVSSLPAWEEVKAQPAETRSEETASRALSGAKSCGGWMANLVMNVPTIWRSQ